MGQWARRAGWLLASASAFACGSLLEVGDAPGQGGDGGAGADDASMADVVVTGCPLVIDKTAIDFGDVVAGKSKELALAVSTTSATDVAFNVQTAGVGFGVTPTSDAVTASTPASLKVSFAPDSGAAGSSPTGTLTIKAAGCSFEVPLSANVINAGDVALSTTSVALQGPCGQRPASGVLTMQNPNATAALWYTSALTPRVVVNPDAGAVPQDASANLDVGWDQNMPAAPGDGGTGMFTLNVGATARNVGVRTTATGAALSLDNMAVSLTPAQMSDTTMLTNNGNTPITLKTSTTSASVSVEPAPTDAFTLAPGASVVIRVTWKTMAPGSATVTVLPQNNGHVCGFTPILDVQYSL